MKITSTSVDDVKILTPKVFHDHRGFFLETLRTEWFKENVANYNFVQENQSHSKKGVLRGLHYQTTNTQGKLVRVVNGAVFDVAVDLRLNSKKFGKWVGVVLSSENFQQLWVPPGFAHGFYVLSDHADLVYKCTDLYHPQSEQTLLFNDPKLAINWPLSGDVVVSEKDLNGKSFDECIKF